MRRAMRGAMVLLLLTVPASGGCGGDGSTASGGGGNGAASSGSSGSGSGSSSSGAPAPVTPSCKDLLAAAPKTPDGIYDIDPDGAGPTMALKVFCDMTTDGGGWTLFATLKTTSTFTPIMDPNGWMGWSDDWWTKPHGEPTNPKSAFSNQDVRVFKPLISPTTILRMTTAASPISRYQFGMQPADWDLWNMGRYTQGGNSVEVVGPFELPNVMVSRKLDLSGAVQVHLNGHWHNGVLAWGSGPLQGDMDTEGIAARYQTQSNMGPQFGYAGEVRADTPFNLWIR